MLRDRVKNFFTREHDPHRAARPLRESDGDRLHFGIDFTAVTAAEIRHDHPDLRHRNFKYVGQLGAYHEWVLRRRPDRDIPRLR